MAVVKTNLANAYVILRFGSAGQVSIAQIRPVVGRGLEPSSAGPAAYDGVET